MKILRQKFFKEAKLESRPMFEAVSKFRAKPDRRPKVRPGQGNRVRLGFRVCH